MLVAVFILLAAGKGHNLCGNIGAQLLLAGAALDSDVHTGLVFIEADELQRNNIGSLVQQLIEGVLSVGTGFAEDDGTGGIIHCFSPSVHALAV